ncbi:MAG: hypothetical protein IT249_00645 [Chitinophagaceae bacterium]|nr:hypothetical protein [Chitinophagaceae bacterium]
MSTVKFCILLMLAFFFSNVIYAQKLPTAAAPNPPVNLETVLGNEGMAYQLMINKKLKSIPKLGFFSITSVLGAWKKGPYDGIMSQGLVTYRLFKGFDVVSGFHYTDVTGLRPTAGIIYSYGSPGFLVVANPRIDLHKDAIQETMIMTEYKPKLNEKWRLYSRLQGLYGFSVASKDHARSYILGRLGVNYKEFNFGLAANFDWFGPFKGNQNNYGVFVSAALF